VSAKESQQRNCFFVAWISVNPSYFDKNWPSTRMKFGVLVDPFLVLETEQGFESIQIKSS